jgi:hypothetical protein
VVCGLFAWRRRWPVARTALATTLAVGSHAVLDLLAHGGRGLPLLWPLSDRRFHSPWRILSDAPRGFDLFSGPGMVKVAIELAWFFPIVLFALWPLLGARGWRPLRRAPTLTVVAGGAAPPPEPIAVEIPDPTPTLVPVPVPVLGPGTVPVVAQNASPEADPPLRSSG